MSVVYPLVIISGPSGSGKSTVIAQVMAMRDLPLRLSISATTRPARPGEIDGVHYHFWSEQRFAEELRQDGFLEHAFVHGYHYGTLRREVEPYQSQGRMVILEIDVQGADEIRGRTAGVVSIFIRTSSWEAYEERLRQRGTETEERLQKRLAAARMELARADAYEFVVVNDRIDSAVAEVHAILKHLLENTAHAR